MLCLKCLLPKREVLPLLPNLSITCIFKSVHVLARPFPCTVRMPNSCTERRDTLCRNLLRSQACERAGAANDTGLRLIDQPQPL